MKAWGRFGLSRVCEICRALTPARFCKLTGSRDQPSRQQFACKNCRERRTKYTLPELSPVPANLGCLSTLEKRLLASAHVDQVIIDKLPSGGPSAQWGRMYCVPMEEPALCHVLDGAELGENGEVYVNGVQGMMASTARLQCLEAGLRALKLQHAAYKCNAGVDKALQNMQAILAKLPTASAAGGAGDEGKEEDVEVTYLMARDPAIPKADLADLQELRRKAKQTIDNLDTLLFPYLFPDGTGGFDQWAHKKFSEYARKRILGQDGRFEKDPAYLMWLLEEQMRRRLSGNVNVRMKGQVHPQFGSRYEDFSRKIYTALRDIPGTQPYLYAKKGIAMSMYEQLGKPQFFLTLTCHARQPDILAACVTAELLRQREPTADQRDVEAEAAEVLRHYMTDENYVWHGMTANQLCNSMPGIVARQFMHGLRQLLHWLQGGDGDVQFKADDADEQDRPDQADDDEEGAEAAPEVGRSGESHSMKKERPPFKILDYIVRIEWQKRGYPHAHILLWADVPDVAAKQRQEEAPTDQGKKEQRVDWSDEEACHRAAPTCAEDLSDKYICTKSPQRWLEDPRVSEAKREVNAKLAAYCEHKCGPYCGKYTVGSCRFGFPRAAEEQTRRRTPQEQFSSRWKASLAARRHEDDSMMGQYNTAILRHWRASMDLQVISELTCASKYILGYAFKSEEDIAAKQRVDEIVQGYLEDSGTVDLSNHQVYRAAHAATQARTTSTFEAAHLLLGYPTVLFSRDNEWVQVGPPSTWTLVVPQLEEADALQDPAVYAATRRDEGTDLPKAHRVYRFQQQHCGDKETEVPVEGGKPVRKPWREITFFDFVAGFKFIAKKMGEEPEPRKRPAVVGHRNYNPDLQPEEFYYSKLLLHLVWTEPGDWLRDEDGGSHAAAFHRIVKDLDHHPTFLESIALPKLDGTVQAARELQAVQSFMYLKANVGNMMGLVHCRADEQNYEDSLRIMQALKDRHGNDIEFMAPDTVPTGPATDIFAPVEGGEADGYN